MSIAGLKKGVLLLFGKSIAVCSTRCFRRETIYLEYQKHTRT
jgi:hypothetical protein